MTREERIEALLEGFTPEERVRLRDAKFTGTFLSSSRPTVYRLAADGVLPHVKMPGRDRGARGRAGSVRFRLVDLVGFIVDREVGQVPREAKGRPR